MFLSSFFSIFFLFLVNISLSAGDRLFQIQQRGCLVVAMPQEDAPPFFMTNEEGKEMGVDMEIAQKIAHHLQVKLKILRTARTYDEVVQQVVEGKADLGISNLSITLDRAQKINYSDPYATLQKSIILNQKTFSDLKKSDTESFRSFFRSGVKLGVVRGGSYVEFAQEEFPEAKLVLYDTWSKLLKDLDKGILGGGFWDGLEVQKSLFFRPHGSFRYQVVGLKALPDKIAIAVPKGSSDFLRWVNTFIELKLKPLKTDNLLSLYRKYHARKNHVNAPQK